MSFYTDLGRESRRVETLDKGRESTETAMKDCVQYLERLLSPRKGGGAKIIAENDYYSTEPDQEAIDNLHKLQENRPLKPPSRTAKETR
jgi:hypothetical protein